MKDIRVAEVALLALEDGLKSEMEVALLTVTEINARQTSRDVLESVFVRIEPRHDFAGVTERDEVARVSDDRSREINRHNADILARPVALRH